MGSLLLMIGVLVLCIVGFKALSKVQKGIDENAKSKGDEYYKQYKEGVKKLDYGKGYGIKCPNCGREHVKYISTANRVGSVTVFGLASGKIGKSYECPDCKYKW